MIFRREKAPKLVLENVRVVDPGVDEYGRPVSIYWEARMPRDELLAFDSQARCRSTDVPRTKRMFTWWFSPIVMMLLVFAALFLNAPDPMAILPAAAAGAVFIGGPLGALVAFVIVKRWLGAEAWWHIMRIDVRDAARYTLQPRDGHEDKWVLSGIVPRPLMAEVDDDGKALEAETEEMLWRNEQLRLGQDGWAVNNFLRGMGAARSREELLKQGVIQAPRPTLDKPGPADRGNPR